MDNVALFKEAQELEAFLCKESLITKTDSPDYDNIRVKVRRLYIDAALSGNVAAKSRAAVCLAYCIGGLRDPVQHKIFVEEAANAGDALALGMRAENYWFGENGFPVDLDKCEKDSLRSYSDGSWLGATVYSWVLRKYAELSGNLILVEQADKICKDTLPDLVKEAKMGDSIAQDWLAWRYYNGEGISKDPVAAAAWFRLSADNGLGWAQHWLGMRYQSGDGVIQDKLIAKYWLTKAAAKGIQDAVEQLKVLDTEEV